MALAACGFRSSAARGRGLDAEQFLHVMTDFMGQYVGFSKLSRSGKASFQFVEKTKVDVDFFVFRTIKGASRGLSRTAGGVDGIAKQDQFGVMVLRAGRRKNLGPRSLRVVENEGYELNQWLLGLILYQTSCGPFGSILLSNR
jgi:hypothetical protein